MLAPFPPPPPFAVLCWYKNGSSDDYVHAPIKLVCLGEFLNVSSCAQFNYNQTCLCADPVYNDEVEICVLSSCTVKEALGELSSP